MIDNPTTSEEQKTNLRAAINLYNKGILPGPWRTIQDGKVVELRVVDFNRAWWSEVCFCPSLSLNVCPLILVSRDMLNNHHPYPAGLSSSGHEVVNPCIAQNGEHGFNTH